MIPFLSRIPEEDRPVYRIDVIAGAYYGLFVGFLVPFVPIILKRLGASPLQLGLSLAAPFLALMISFPLYKYVGGCKALDLVTVPTFFTRLSVIVIGLKPQPGAILAVFLLSQFAEGFGMAPYTRVLKSMYSNRGRSRAMGYVRTIIGLFQVISSGLGGYLLDRGNMPLLFFLAGVSGAISSWYFRKIFSADRSPEFGSQAMSWGDISRTNQNSRGFFWLNVSLMIFGFGNLIAIGVLPTLLVERFNISNFALGSLSALTNLVLILGFSFVGNFVARAGADRGIILGFAAGVMNPWFYLFASHVEYLAIPYALLGMVTAGVDMSWSLLILSMVKEEDIAAYSSVYTFLQGIRGVIAMMVSNLLLPIFGMDVFLILGGVCTGIGMIFILYHRRELRNS